MPGESTDVTDALDEKPGEVVVYDSPEGSMHSGIGELEVKPVVAGESHNNECDSSGAASTEVQQDENEVEDEEDEDSREQDENGDEDGDEDEETNESDDEDEDEEDDEDDEPALKYERLGGAFQDLFKKDSASALAISCKLLVTLPPYFRLPHLLRICLRQSERTQGLCMSWI